MSKQLNEPITDNGIRNTNFFNGRLLTAKDLQTDQEAERSQRWQLGRAVGDGVVEGFEVSLVSPGDRSVRPIVGITKGLALNLKGQILSLPADDQVTLIRRIDLPPPEAGIFGECGLATSRFTTLDRGAYVLVVGPVSGFRERAPMRSVEPNNAMTGCGSKYAVEGVQFDLIKLDIESMTSINAATRTLINRMLSLNDAASISKLRNILAHVCFDTEDATEMRRDPFKRLPGSGTPLNYGGLAEMRRLGLITDCQIPLALIYWSGSGVQFVDNWAARRLARWMLDLDALSILRSYGYERSLQFQSQVKDLFDQLGGLATVRMQDYFRYLPAVGYFPVSGAKSPRGFHPTNFFRQFTTGAAGVVTTERFGALLRESFACPDIDLQPSPNFQIYQVVDNVRAVAASTPSSQLYQIFVSRAFNGPLTADGVAQTFKDAWDAYRGLIKRRVFLPPGTDEAKIAAQIGITAAIRDVLDITNRQHALAGACALDTDAALGAFQSVYDMQNDLAAYLESAIPGIVDTQDREGFARQLAIRLNSTSVGGQPGLLAAIRARSLPAAVNAQNVINAFVGTWSGEGVAIGPFGSAWTQSPDGQDLVPGVPGTLRQIFVINNGTDKRLRINLEATLAAAHGNWDNTTTIENSEGQEISFVDLGSGTTASVVVKVRAPAGAEVGDTATLTLRTIVAPPTNRTTQSTLPLRVSSSTGGAVTSSVAFDGPVIIPAGDPNNAPSNTTFTYGYNLLFTAPAGTEASNFRLIVNLTSATVAEWAVRILDLSSATTNPNPGEFRREFGLTPGSSRLVSVIVRTPTSPSGTERSAAFGVRVEAVSLTSIAPAEHPQTFNIRVRAGA